MHILYMVAAGKPVTTYTCAARAAGDVRALPRSAILEHVQMMTIKVQFKLHKHFKQQHQNIYAAIQGCCAFDGSAWEIVKDFTCPPKARGKARPRQVHVDSVRTLWEWLKSTRRVVNSKHARMVWRNEVPMRI